MFRKTALALLLLPAIAYGQDRYATRAGEVSFFSHTPVEDIDAVNHKATCVADLSGGQIQVSMLIKAFEFEKALMQELRHQSAVDEARHHQGRSWEHLALGLVVFAKGITAEDARKSGKFPVTLEGELTIHGVAQKRSIPGTIEVDATGALKATTEFIVKPADHGIKVPGGVNVAEEISGKAALDLRKM